MLKMASGGIAGFDVYGFWSAIFGSLIISVISWLLNSFINEHGTLSHHTINRRTRHHGPNRHQNQSKIEKDTIDLENKGDDHWE